MEGTRIVIESIPTAETAGLSGETGPGSGGAASAHTIGETKEGKI
jgi:hypothetical protein